MPLRFLTILLLTINSFSIAAPPAQSPRPHRHLPIQKLATRFAHRPSRRAVCSGNTPASTFTPPGPFAVTFAGNLQLKLRDDLSFSLAGRGTIKLSINGQEISPSAATTGVMSQPKHYAQQRQNAVLIEYTSPATVTLLPPLLVEQRISSRTHPPHRLHSRPDARA